MYEVIYWCSVDVLRDTQAQQTQTGQGQDAHWKKKQRTQSWVKHAHNDHVVPCTKSQ